MRSMALETAWAAAPPEFVMSGYISRPKAILATHVILTSIVAGAGVILPIAQLDPESLVYPACALVTASFGWILWSWFALRKTLFDPYALFMIAAALFNGGQSLLELFGMNAGGILRSRTDPEILIRALYLIAMSVLCLHCGALLAFSRRPTRRTKEASVGRQRAALLVGWLLLAVAAVPTIRLLKGSFDLVLDYGYLGLFRQQAGAPVSWALSGFLVPGTIFLLAGSKNSRGLQFFCLALTGAYAAAYLFLGSRGAAAMSCVAVAWVFDRAIHRIPRPLILASTLLALLVFPLVRENRNTGGRYRMSWASQLETWGNLENPISSSLAEMGYTLVTVTHTVALVPEIRPYDLGKSYFYAAAAVVPNLGWDVHPSVTHGLLSDWLIGIVDPVVAHSGGGLGFSFIAEAYLNFGWFGGPLCLVPLGFFIAALFLGADGADPAQQALAGSFLSFFFIFARGESAIVTRGLVWYAVLPYLLVAILTLRRGAGRTHL